MSTAAPLDLYLMAVKSDLKTFMRQAFKQLHPIHEFLDNWHIDAIIYCLEQSIEGKMPRLIINLPPRQLKSFLTSVVLPAFILGHDASAKIICVSYSDELATTLARDFKRIIESQWYKDIFPNVKKSKLTGNDFVTDQGGFRYATSVGGTITGKGGDFIIVDDPIKPTDTNSDKIRQASNEWYKATLLSRLEDKKHSVLILVMQRLHVNDLTGYVQTEGNFNKLSLPAIAIKDNEKIPVGPNDYYLRQAGEALHEDRESLQTLEKMRNSVGQFIFASQYQQSPETPEGLLFKSKYLQIINEDFQIQGGGLFWVSVDSALSESENADYSAISVGYSNQQGHFILSAERGRWDYETLKSKVMKYTNDPDKNFQFIVEAAGSGISLIQYLRTAGIKCLHYRPQHDKMTRAAYVLPIFVQKRVFIKRQAGKDGWIEDYINEFLSFPNGRYDDQVDSLVQVLGWAERLVNSGSKFYYLGLG